MMFLSANIVPVCQHCGLKTHSYMTFLSANIIASNTQSHDVPVCQDHGLKHLVSHMMFLSANTGPVCQHCGLKHSHMTFLSAKIMASNT